MRYGRKSRERERMKNAKTQSLNGFKANLSFTIRDAFPREVE